jgi:sialate O-acetylesterase
MGLGTAGTINASAVIAAAGTHGTGLRIMQVMNEDPQYCNVTAPQDDFTTQIAWSHPTPNTTGVFSAVCYYTGLQMSLTHPSVPIGMIASSWGGTAIEPWMGPNALTECGEGTVLVFEH